MKKAIILFSGGLDSILAVKILQKQNIKLLGIFFKSYFFHSDQEKQAKLVAKSMKLPLKVIDFSKEQIKIIRNPKYGYGKNMNPCIDCRILMFEQAKKIMKDQNFDFISTGEVLGQRPMSQNKQTMELIERQARLKGYILRPLCAKLLKPSIAEESGWIGREKMFDIRGRSRKKQIELAKKYKIKKYPSPAGGCLLTDPEFSKRLEKLFKVCAKCQNSDIELLKIGRHLWEGNVKIIIGRNEEENNSLLCHSERSEESPYQTVDTAQRAKQRDSSVALLRSLRMTRGGVPRQGRSRDILIEMKNYTGPLTLIRNYSKKKINKTVIEKAKKLTQFYSIKARNKKNVEFNVVQSK